MSSRGQEVRDGDREGGEGRAEEMDFFIYFFQIFSSTGFHFPGSGGRGRKCLPGSGPGEEGTPLKDRLIAGRFIASMEIRVAVISIWKSRNADSVT